MQALRGFGSQVSLSALYGNGMDRMQSTIFGTQLIDGSSDVMVSERPFSAEHFQVQIDATGETFPSIAELGVSFKLRSQTQRRA